MAHKGIFKPANPNKYKGDHTNIVYRSSWEAHFFAYLDKHPYVNWWQSEEVVVKYISPKDNRIHRYFPDVIVNVTDPSTQKKRTIMIEIKPHKQTLPPDPAKRNATPSGRVSRRFLNEVMTYAINDAKWKAAREYCADRGWDFEIYTEKELGVR